MYTVPIKNLWMCHKQFTNQETSFSNRNIKHCIKPKLTKEIKAIRTTD